MVFSEDAIAEIRRVASNRLQQIAEDTTTQRAGSWVRNNHLNVINIDSKEGETKASSTTTTTTEDPRSEQCIRFDTTGFLHIPNFVDQTTCQTMKEQMSELVLHNWHPPGITSTTTSTPSENGSTTTTSSGGSSSSRLDTFGTDDIQNVQRGDYFLESADKIHFFAEPDALEEEEDVDNGNSGKKPQQRLKPMYHTNKIAALNKVGHALHLQPSSSNIFYEYTMSNPIKELVLDLGWQDPVVPQSMYIFKQNQIGGAVHSHQDSTFLYTTPHQTCLGLWLALDDATLNNGCLWIRPYSHRLDKRDTSSMTTNCNNTTRRQYQRNIDHFGQDSIVARSNNSIDATQPTFVMKTLISDPNVPWDGSLPGRTTTTTTTTTSDDNSDKNNALDSDGYALLDAGFCPIECSAGDLLVFVGDLDHLSLPNTSNDVRHTFQLHLVEGPKAGIEWSPYNWLQYPSNKSFVRLLKEE